MDTSFLSLGITVRATLDIYVVTVTVLPAPHFLRNLPYSFLDSQGRLITLGNTWLASPCVPDTTHDITMERWDKNTNVWTILAEDQPAPAAISAFGAALDATDHLMRAGGRLPTGPFTSNNTVDLHDPVADQWNSIATTTHFDTDCCVWIGPNGHFFAGGGVDQASGTPSTFLAEFIAGAWVQRASSLDSFNGYGRNSNVLVDAAGKRYFYGGNGATTARSNIYNPATDTWALSSFCNFSPGNFGFDSFQSCIDPVGNVIYTTVGTNVVNGHTITLARYNIATDDWTQLTTLTTTLNNPYPTAPVFHPATNAVYLFGIPETRTPQVGDNRVWKYDVASTVWSTTGDVTQQPRQFQYAVIPFDGVGFYFSQGATVTGCPSSVVEYFVPAAGAVARKRSWAAVIGD